MAALIHLNMMIVAVLAEAVGYDQTPPAGGQASPPPMRSENELMMIFILIQ